MTALFWFFLGYFVGTGSLIVANLVLNSRKEEREIDILKKYLEEFDEVIVIGTVPVETVRGATSKGDILQ
jgi:nitrogenase subunit NifH